MHQNGQKIENKKIKQPQRYFEVIDLPPIHCEDALCVINLNKVSAIFKPIICFSLCFFPNHLIPQFNYNINKSRDDTYKIQSVPSLDYA